MKLAPYRGECGNGRTCPQIAISDRATLVVQGYIHTGDAGTPNHDTIAVEVPITLIPELVGKPARPNITFTDRDSALISGHRVTDPEALDQLELPAGEDAVEVPYELLAEIHQERAC